MSKLRHVRVSSVQSPFWDQLISERIEVEVVPILGSAKGNKDPRKMDLPPKYHGFVLSYDDHRMTMYDVRRRVTVTFMKHAISCVLPKEPFQEAMDRPIDEPPRRRRRGRTSKEIRLPL